MSSSHDSSSCHITVANCSRCGSDPWLFWMPIGKWFCMPCWGVVTASAVEEWYEDEDEDESKEQSQAKRHKGGSEGETKSKA